MLRKFLREEEGQTTVEYLLIIAVMVAVITMFGSRLQKLVEALTNKVFGDITSRISGLMGK